MAVLIKLPIAKAVDATLYENWKDVDGIYFCRSRIVANPELMYESLIKKFVSFLILALMFSIRGDVPVMYNIH